MLHRTLNHPSLQGHIFGGKGIGSQGDGSAQFLCKGPADQEKVVEIITNELGMDAMPLVLGESGEA